MLPPVENTIKGGRQEVPMIQSMLVTYDLCNPGKNYDGLINAIRAYPFAECVCLSAWIIKTADTCTSVRDYLLLFMDSNDRLFVAALTSEAAWHNVMCGTDRIQNKF
jgi:hypothetical protein